jgi:hypothetical protein
MTREANREGRTSRIRAAMLPLLVAAIAVPIVAAFMLGGPPAGLAMGAVAASTIVVVAVRSRPDGPIEVAPSAEGRPRLLVVIDEAIDEPAAVAVIADAADRLPRAAPEAEPEVLVLSPARNRPLAEWLSDVDEARLDAQRRLVLTLGSLAAAGVDARGEVGDPDPLQAVEDALRRFPADEVLIASADRRAATALLDQLEPRLGVPVKAQRAGLGSRRPSAPS